MDTAIDAGAWHHRTDVAQMVSATAAALGLLIAGPTAWPLAAQTRTNARVARENSALDMHREYLRLCIEWPELSCSDAMPATLKRSSFEGIMDEEISPKKERAFGFLSYVLGTVEQLLSTTDSDKSWQTIGLRQLEYHRDLIVVFRPVIKKLYGRNLRRLIDDELLSKAPAGRAIVQRDEPSPSRPEE